MPKAYKAEVWSGDGSTKIRNITLVFPDAKSNGNKTTSSGYNAGQNAADLCSFINNNGQANAITSVSVSFIFGAGPAGAYRILMGSYGFTGIITAEDLFGSGYAPIRLVFKNGSYIKITPAVDSSANISLTLDYYTSNNTKVGTLTQNAGRGYGATPTSGNYYFNWKSIPFPLYDVYAGQITDWRARCYEAQGLFNDSQLSYFVSVTNTMGNLGMPNSGSAPLNLETWYNGIKPVDTDDPYVDIPDSEPSGPAEGSGIPESDPIPAPSLPTVSVLDTGFVGLFNPTLYQVQQLADYMWTGLFDINTFKKIFADPMDCILGFNMVPVSVPSGSAAAVRVGNISTGVQMNVATSQWVEVDCGSITVDLPYGCYLDYAPYSKFSLYLPYIGIVELSTDDVVGRTISLKYHVDILSCSCVAFLTCGTQTLYQWTGSCGYSIPLTGDNFRQMIANIINIAATIGGAVASGGLTAPATIAAGASVSQNVMNSKPEIHRSGAIGSSAGMMGIQTPFLIMELPNACKPEKQYHYLGYPGFITTAIGGLSGYAEFESVILDGIGCTSEERQMIESYCSGGIYV